MDTCKVIVTSSPEELRDLSAESARTLLSNTRTSVVFGVPRTGMSESYYDIFKLSAAELAAVRGNNPQP
mgnify:CR=1 FL=1